MSTSWKNWQKINDDDSPEVVERKKFNNSILADRKPYFMKYKYEDLKKEYSAYKKEKEIICKREFGMSLNDLLQLTEEDLTEQQRIFRNIFYKRLNIVDSPCEMNRLCHYVESVDFEIKQKVRSQGEFDYHCLMSVNSDSDIDLSSEVYQSLVDVLEQYLLEQESYRKINNKRSGKSGIKFNVNENNRKELMIEGLKNELTLICVNEEALSNYLVYYFYATKKSLNKSLLWSLCGQRLFKNIKDKAEFVYYPEKIMGEKAKDVEGDLIFLYEPYEIKKVPLEELFQEESNVGTLVTFSEDETDDYLIDT